MSEQNIVNVMVIPDVPKVLPGEQLYVYVPKASFTSPGIIAYNNTQFRIDGNFLFIREDYVSPGVQQKIDELKQYTDDKLQLKQDKEDNNISLAQRPAQKSVVGAINDLGTLTGQAQSTADDAIRKIGDLSTLTTDEKSTAVNAINEVDQHTNVAQSTADEATNLANTGISKADQAQATADNATTLANTGISKAEQAQSTANTAVDKANDAKATAQEAILKADGRSTSIGFMTAKDAVTALNGYPRTQLKGGDTIWIVEDGTPDLWVTDVAQESVPYNYTTKDKFNQDLVDNKVLQIGYFKTAYQESDGKPVTIAWQNVLVKSTDWVASTEFEDFPYEAKIELTDFVDYTTVPQVVFDIADTMSGNYAPICKSGDKCVYIYSKVQNEITLKTVITFAPNVNGASIVGGGYNNRGKWVASTTYEIDDLVYTDNGQFVCIEGITSTTSPEQDTAHWQATFVATGKTKNGLKFSGQNTDGNAVQKTFDGSQAVEVSFDETTMTAKEVNGVLKVGAKGTIPEALPQTAGALKSGNLPTSGWGVSASLWTGSKVMPYNPGYVGNIGKQWASSSDELEELPNGWQATMNGTLYSNRTASLDSDSSTRGIQFGITGTGVGADEAFVRIYTNGDIYVWNNKSSETRTITQIGCSKLSKQTYTITDTSITANSDIIMELTDDGGVKSYSMEAGSITVIRDTVPTQVIPYTYKVKQTNASGQFTLINHYGENTLTASLQKASVPKSGNLPTSGWSTSAAKELFYGNLNFAGYSSSATDNGKILPPYDYTSKNGTSYWTGTQIRGKNIEYCKQKTDNNGKKYISLYFESGYGINSHKEAEIQIYDDGTVKAWHYSDGAYAETVKIVSTFLSDYIYTISDTDITSNSDVLMELTDAGETKSYSIKTGKITVIRSAVPTQPIPYTYKVKQTNASGQFTVLNHFVPNVPVVPTKTSQLENDSGFITANDIPTITYKKVSGELPTSGWSAPDEGWKQNTLPANTDWKSVTYGDGKYVAVTFYSDKGAYSIDGVTWTEMSMPAVDSWIVTYGNGKYVALASGNTKGAYSTNGITWTEMTLPASRSWNGLTYGNGKFVAVAASSDKGAYSTDGVTWTEMSMPTSRDWASVTYGDGKFVAVVVDSLYGAYSADGISWTEMSMPASRIWRRVAYGNGKFVAVGAGSDKGAYSTDGISWTEMSMPTSRSWIGLTYGDDKFVAVAYNSDKGAYSTDGITWTETTLPASIGWNDVTYGDGEFVAVSQSSANGAYWKAAAAYVTYTISDTDITTNTSVKMYLTDKGGVKAQSKANGSITVIRDTVPTTAIPYEYEVEGTSAEGLFEVINAYIPSAGEWQNWSDTSVLTEEGLYEIVTTEYPSDGNKTLFVQYEQGKPNNGACWVSVATANSISVVTPICSGDGTLRVERRLANSSGPADLLTFKYRKIN